MTEFEKFQEKWDTIKPGDFSLEFADGCGLPRDVLARGANAAVVAGLLRPTDPYILDAPSGWKAADKIIVQVEARLDWKDRLLVMIGRPVGLTVRVYCENRPGKTESNSDVWAWRIVWPWLKNRGYEAKEA